MSTDLTTKMREAATAITEFRREYYTRTGTAFRGEVSAWDLTLWAERWGREAAEEEARRAEILDLARIVSSTAFVNSVEAPAGVAVHMAEQIIAAGYRKVALDQ